MSWGHVTADLVRLHDGVLDDGRAREVREHLTRCAECREAGDAIAFSRVLLASLSPAELRDADGAAARAAMLEAASRQLPRRSHWVRWTALAAASAVAAMVAWLLTPHVEFVAPPAERRSIERIAIAAEHATVAVRTGSIENARRLVQRHTGVVSRIQDGNGRRVIGVSASNRVPIATILFEIDRRPVALAVASAGNVADAPPSLHRAKRLEIRHDGDLRVFTWSASGDAYSLVVPRGVVVADACAICHDGTRTLAYIRRATQRL